MSTKGARDYRPKLHYTPAKGWINDPNGLVYENGQYHLFCQFYPHDTQWGPMHWGHAVSQDLITWEHKPVALEPDALGHIFSGSAVYDSENASGLGFASKPPIITMFTHSGETQQQSIAYSINGTDFIKYEGNPVIPNPGIQDFRDPKVFHNPFKNCWSVVIAAGDHLDFYASKDMLQWTKTGEFGPEGNHCEGIWECPDLFPLSAPDGREVWVLIVSMTRPEEAGGPRTQYFLGSFNGDTFVCDRPHSEILWLDPGFDNYAAVTFDNTKDRILMGWGSNWVYAKDTPTNEYCGSMTLARRLSLVDTPLGLRLSSTPFCTLGDLMDTPHPLNTEEALPEEVFGLRIESNGPFMITLSNENQEEMVFGLNESNAIYLDRSRAGEKGFSEAFSRDLFQRVVTKRLFEGKMVMEVVFDVSMLEVFADQGTFACTQLLYPTRPYQKITIQGNAKVEYFPLKYK